VTDIEMKNHELSANWFAKYRIYTNSEKDKVKQASMSAIYSFKASKIENRIKKIQKVLMEKGNDIEEEERRDLQTQQVLLERIKRAINEKLGRIVLR
jgi:hypothetical protein